MLAQYGKSQVWPARDAEALVAIGKRLVFASAPIAAPLIPGDQLIALLDHGHAHVGAGPFLACQAFGLRQDPLAYAATLAFRVNGKHPEIGGVTLALDVTRGKQPAI